MQLNKVPVLKDLYTTKYICRYSLITYMRLAHPSILCPYLTMVLRISYASTNLPARGPILRTSLLVVQLLRISPLVVQHAWTHSVTNLPARKTLKCEHGIYELFHSYPRTRVPPIWTFSSVLITGMQNTPPKCKTTTNSCIY